MTAILNRLVKTVHEGHNVCFNGKIKKIIPKLFLLLLLIWSTGPNELEDKF